MASTPNLDYKAVHDVLNELKSNGYPTSQKFFEKIVKKHNIRCYVMDGQLMVDYPEYLSRAQGIQKDLADHYKSSRDNIQKGQLKSAAIVRGILKALKGLKATDPIVDTILKSVQAEFTNKTKQYGSPPADAQNLLDYIILLLANYDKRSGSTFVPSSVAPTANAVSSPTTPTELEQFKKDIDSKLDALTNSMVSNQNVISLIEQQKRLVNEGAIPAEAKDEQVQNLERLLNEKSQELSDMANKFDNLTSRLQALEEEKPEEEPKNKGKR